MKRTIVLTMAAGLVTASGIVIGMHAAESGHRGDGGFRGSHSGGGHGWGHRGGGHRWGRHHRRGHRMKRMMRRFDTNEDDQLTQAEIDDARRALVTKHDANSDGQLTLAEFQNLWLEVRRRRMVRSFQRIDEDGDAAITIDEFLEPFSGVVKRLDRNEDGVLDKNDRRRRYGKRRHRRRGGEDSERSEPAPEGGETEQ
ncbi:MAG: EF-hand domain-containing protein [Hyphomicrobiaceae bacterium]